MSGDMSTKEYNELERRINKQAYKEKDKKLKEDMKRRAKLELLEK